MIRRITKVLILTLAVIAAVVATGLIGGRSMWAWIVAYWIVLTSKNIVDYISSEREDERK